MTMWIKPKPEVANADQKAVCGLKDDAAVRRL